MVFKIDFEKAFDTIEHKAILQILKCKGFPPLVISWVNEVLSSGSSSVLLNGVQYCQPGFQSGAAEVAYSWGGIFPCGAIC